MAHESKDSLPIIIQGGMGAGVSSWHLARAVSAAGQLGVISGTAMAIILARRLADGDPGGHMRQALEAFPIPGVAERLLDRYYIEGGRPADKPYKSVPMPAVKPGRLLEDLLVAGNFVEVWLAKQGHNGPVGINLLEKIQLPTVPSLYGAMLAGVDYVLMGAGIPRAIPGILDQLARHEATTLRLDVENAAEGHVHETRFDPAAYCGDVRPQITRPKFLAIISSVTLAQVMAKKASGKVDGFIIEGPTAGGHNAPPRGKLQLTSEGEPIYTDRDKPDLAKIAALGLPFWLAGSFAEPEAVQRALNQGAVGVQIGTAFAYCEESGLAPEFKHQVIALSREHQARVLTDPIASPTGFPFKVVQLAGSMSEALTYESRSRICDLGYLRHAYEKPDGTLGWRCPAEPIGDYVRKGGDETDTSGRKCMCNSLMANIGVGQVRPGDTDELALLTSGDDVANVARFAPADVDAYSATDVIDYVMNGVAAPPAAPVPA